MAAGQTIGAGIGAAAGSAIAPGVGTQAGMAIGSSLGGMYDAWKQKKAGDSAMPEYIDPMQSSYMAELNQKRKAIETGADFASAVGEADTSQAATNEALLRTSAGNPGAAMQGLLLAQRNAGDVKNRAIAQGQQQQTYYNNAYQNMLNQISARKLQLELYNVDQARARQAQSEQAASQNFFAGLGSMAGNAGAGGGFDLSKIMSLFGGGNKQPAAPVAAVPSAAQVASPVTPTVGSDVIGGGTDLGELASLGVSL